MTNFQKYEAYKESGVEWIGEIPPSWEIKRLRNICDMLVSNVDKHTKPLEHPVRLCNYVDVYKNEFITSEIHFMEATATADEIRRFSIKIDDVIITKDSEDWLDIGVPALVKHEDEKLICGYHLAILRPKRSIIGGFLHRAILSQYIRTQFSIKANGVTRYGISHGAILGTIIITPPLPEQTRIAHFLDQKTAQIDQAIAQKERLIELLKERRQILIHNAVTRGLDPNVRMKDSGVEWIGEVPEHWEIMRAKFLFNEIDDRSNTGDEELLSVSHLTGVTPRSEKNVTMFQAEDYAGSKLCRKGDLIFNIMWAWMGALGVSDRTGIVSPSYAIYRQKASDKFNTWFLELLLTDTNYIAHYNRVSTGLHSSRLRFYSNMFFDMKIGFPSRDEQEEIVGFLRSATQKIATAITLKQSEIEKLKEYKATLINSAVTGKIKIV